MTDRTVWTEQFIADAREIMRDDPDLLADREGFMRVMWPDDDLRRTYGMTRADYADLLNDVFDTLKDERVARALERGDI